MIRHDCPLLDKWLLMKHWEEGDGTSNGVCKRTVFFDLVGIHLISEMVGLQCKTGYLGALGKDKGDHLVVPKVPYRDIILPTLA